MQTKCAHNGYTHEQVKEKTRPHATGQKENLIFFFSTESGNEGSALLCVLHYMQYYTAVQNSYNTCIGTDEC